MYFHSEKELMLTFNPELSLATCLTEETEMAEKQLAENESTEREFKAETTMDELLGEVQEMRHGLDVDKEFVDHLAKNTMRRLTNGEVVTGIVVKVDKDNVMIDVGYKSEGILPRDDLKAFGGELSLGDSVEVSVERVSDEEGLLVLSRRNVEKMNTLRIAEEHMKQDKTIKGMVTRRVKGGLRVDIGCLEAFLPGSQIELSKVTDFDKYVGKEMEVKIIKVNTLRNNVIASRRKLLEEQRLADKSQVIANLKVDEEVEGRVKNLTNYGAFVDIGGIDGLLHITDLSWERVNHPSDILKLGETIKVKIIEVDEENCRISLGLKQINPDPWDSIKDKLQVNTVVSGTVVRLTNYGAFVKLFEGVEGLIHISEMSWTKRIKHPSSMLQENQEIDAKILDVDFENRKISLGLKQTQENPWDSVATKYHEGDIVKGEVRSITDFGAFITLEEGVDALLHIKDMSWSGKIKHGGELLKKDQEIEAKIISLEVENHKIALGLKQMTPDPWEGIEDRFKVGQKTKGKMVNLTNFGIFVELATDVEGLLHLSELSADETEEPAKHFQIGDEIDVEILKLDVESKRIALSRKSFAAAAAAEEQEAPRSEKSDEASSLEGETAKKEDAEAPPSDEEREKTAKLKRKISLKKVVSKLLSKNKKD